MGQDDDLGNKGVIFSDYLSFTLLEAMVSGKIGIHPHFYEQSAVGGRHLFYSAPVLKEDKP